jgi:RimJ/RimL family protein N-acetyltransferase
MNKWMAWLNKLIKGQGADWGDRGPGRTGSAQVGNGATQSVPIREIQATHTQKIKKHLKALGAGDRYLRFGYAATDEQIEAYVDSLDFERDSLFGIYNRRLDLIGMAHLSYSINPDCASCAEFGVSVAKTARGRGYGTRLFERAITHSRNEGVRLLFVHALSENTAMIKIAKRAGARVEREGSNSQAHLLLPPADFDSRVEEMLDQQVAWTDYQLKTQAKLFWAWLGMKRTHKAAPCDSTHE